MKDTSIELKPRLFREVFQNFPHNDSYFTSRLQLINNLSALLSQQKHLSSIPPCLAPSQYLSNLRFVLRFKHKYDIQLPSEKFLRIILALAFCQPKESFFYKIQDPFENKKTCLFLIHKPSTPSSYPYLIFFLGKISSPNNRTYFIPTLKISCGTEIFEHPSLKNTCVAEPRLLKLNAIFSSSHSFHEMINTVLINPDVNLIGYSSNSYLKALDMPFLPAPDLQHYLHNFFFCSYGIRTTKKMPIPLAVTITLLLLNRLYHLHTHLYLEHLDLKPSNVFYLEDYQETKLIDFEFTQRFYTYIQHRAGTPSYLPPERWWDGSFIAQGRSDIFALGMILCEIHGNFLLKENRQQFAERYMFNHDGHTPVTASPDALNACLIPHTLLSKQNFWLKKSIYRSMYLKELNVLIGRMTSTRGNTESLQNYADIYKKSQERPSIWQVILTYVSILCRVEAVFSVSLLTPELLQHYPIFQIALSHILNKTGGSQNTELLKKYGLNTQAAPFFPKNPIEFSQNWQTPELNDLSLEKDSPQLDIPKKITTNNEILTEKEFSLQI